MHTHSHSCTIKLLGLIIAGNCVYAVAEDSKTHNIYQQCEQTERGMCGLVRDRWTTINIYKVELCQDPLYLSHESHMLQDNFRMYSTPV